MKRTYVFIVIVFGTMLVLSTVPLSAQVDGSGTPGRIPVWTAPTTLGDSSIINQTDEVVISNRSLNVTGSSQLPYVVRGVGSSSIGVWGASNSNYGVRGESSDGDGVAGSSDSGNGIRGLSASGNGVLGISNSSYGVRGESTGSSVGVNGVSNSGEGVLGLSSSSYGVKGISTSSYGVRGETLGEFAAGVYGEGNNTGDGVVGHGDSGHGVSARSISNYAVLGQSDSSMGVRGETLGFSTGVGGTSVTGNGIGGVSPGTAGVFGAGTRAGIFAGDVGIDGDLLVSGGKFFRIDHPLDPANKYLVHASVESPEAMNLYNGNITTDLSGNATVELPSYFTTLNRDFRYQLTVIGQFAQAIVASEIADNRFTIKTDRPQVKVSWQVTGIRQDAWAQAHPMQVEQPKPERERGTYLHPELFNQPEEKSWAWALSPELMQELKELRAKKNQLKAENSGGQH